MKDTIVTTLPIKPQENIKVGMTLAPLMTEVIGKTTNSYNCFSFNLFNTYDDKDNYLKKYLNTLEINYGITTTQKSFIDKENIDVLLNCIEELIKNGKIIIKSGNVKRCDCGRVDMVTDGIKNYEEGVLYLKKDHKLFCKECGSECKSYMEKGLYLHLDKKIDDKLNIFPTYFNNALHSLESQFRGIDYLISKKRDTGYYIFINGEKFNIDVDSLWMNYINVLDYDSQIIIASNHQLFEMYLINYLNKLYKNKNIYFIATPYLSNPNKIEVEEEFNNISQIQKKLILLYTLKWKGANSNFEYSIIKKIKKLDENKLNDLYAELVKGYDNDLKIDEIIKDTLINRMNFQKSLKKVK